ncbi:hypothetical protein Golax_003795 [Gossypium laxum]|uniref:RNase H type-1 domain-containing protein n=1 Tax=Gossypium laxum TaxID=34288 RepID=A0A7J9AGJ0_9ROSI|nr:hypothetical protein [Gossypium laxum]
MEEEGNLIVSIHLPITNQSDKDCSESSTHVVRDCTFALQGLELVRLVVLAEAMVVLHGLQFAPKMGFSNIILENDSKL